jgi:hypothetical protein
MDVKPAHIHTLTEVLAPLQLSIKFKSGQLSITKGSSTIRIYIIGEATPDLTPQKGVLRLPIDYLLRQPEKVGAIIQSKLGLNKKIFARTCEVKKVTKEAANQFLDAYHLMNSTQSASNYGLFYNGVLLAMASFSKGRRMNRLKENERSFELIRFCCKTGYTVTGGLSKLLNHFIKEKKAGDIMTYVDRQWSEGDAFAKAGFKQTSKTNPKEFLINRKTFERTPLVEASESDTKETHFRIKDAGNLKLIYTPHE